MTKRDKVAQLYELPLRDEIPEKTDEITGELWSSYDKEQLFWIALGLLERLQEN